MPTLYVVFRRTGGGPEIVDAIATSSRRAADQRFALHTSSTFEVLLETANWGEAAERIADERAGRRLPDPPVADDGGYDEHCARCQTDRHHCEICNEAVGHRHAHDDVIEPLDDDADLAAV